MPTSFAAAPNNVSAKVGSSGYIAGSHSLTLRSGDGAKFPALTAGAWLRVTVVRAPVAYSPSAALSDYTVYKVTAVAGDVLTLDPTPLDGTSDRNYADGDVVECRWTKGAAADLHTAVNAIETDATIVRTTSSYANPAFLVSVDASKLTGTFTTTITTTAAGVYAFDATTSTANFGAGFANNKMLQWLDVQGVARTVCGLSSDNNTYLVARPGNNLVFESGSTVLLTLFPTGSVFSGPVTASGFASPIAAKTASYTLTTADTAVTVDATAANVTITLPDMNGLADGRVFLVKRLDGSAHTVTLTGTSGQRIDGAVSQSLPNQWDSLTVKSSRTAGAWYLV